MEKPRQIIKSFSLDEETVLTLAKLKEAGYNASAIIRKALKEAADKIK